MPVTIERMEHLLSIAREAVNKMETTKESVEEIIEEMVNLSASIYSLEPKNETMENAAFSIVSRLKDCRIVCSVSTKLASALGAEEERFKINFSKNMKARNRMRITRQARKDISEEKRHFTLLNDHQMLLQDQEQREWFKQQGEKFHPELGPCDGDPCRKCQKIDEEDIKTATEKLEEINQNPERLISVSDLVKEYEDDGIKYTPAIDENNEWKPKKKEETKENN